MPSPRAIALTYAALLALLALTVGASYLHLGLGNVLLALAIASGKLALVGMVFMHLRWSRPLVVLFALGALFWLAVLYGLTLADYASR